MTYRTLKDGTIICPHRGDPPKEVPEDYMRDPSDPYKFLPQYPPCKFRVIKMVGLCPSGLPRYRWRCELGIDFNLAVCLDCSKREPS